jgi:hypothetical protein
MVEAEICKSWLRSEVGLDCKQNNPGGYMNVVSHLKMHDFFNAQQHSSNKRQKIPLKKKVEIIHRKKEQSNDYSVHVFLSGR